MKNRLPKYVALAATALVCVSFAWIGYAQNDSKTQEKIRLMMTAVQAREGGDLNASKEALEDLLKISPDDEGVQKLLTDVNKDIERKGKGETPVLVGEQAIQKIETERAEAKAKADEAAAKVAAEEKAKAEEDAAAKVEAEKKVAEAKEEVKEGEAAPQADTAISATVRKQQMQVVAAYDLIDSAYDAMDEGKWDEAKDKLNLAEKKIPSKDYSPMSDEVRAELKRARASMANERARLAMADKNLPDAKAFATEYAANEENPNKGTEFVEMVEEFSDNPYNNKISDVNPDYANRLKKVGVLMAKGRKQYLYGDYAGANATFRQIETLDANNIEAKAYQKLISNKLSEVGALTYQATRASMLNEVERAWQRPQVYSGQSAGINAAKADSVAEAKLREIIIPQVSFPDPGVPLAAAIDTLSMLSVDYDKSTEGKKGVNIVLFGGAEGAEGKNVKITLRDQTLGQILDWVTQQAGYRYDVEKETIVVRKASDSNVASMETQDFPISESAVRSMLGIKGATGGGDGGDPFGGGGAAAGGAAGGSTEEGIKSFLVKTGVEFEPGAGLAYDQTKLWVTNTRRNLDKVRNILLRYSDVKQVEIESKFMEVSQGALKEIGFNWRVSNGNNTLFSTYRTDETGNMSLNNRTLDGALSKISSAAQPVTIYTAPDPATTSDATTMNIDRNIPGLPSALNSASGAAAAVNTVLGVINGYSVDMVVTALEQKQGSDLLSAPKVTVMSGQAAEIKVAQEMRYPTVWGEVQSNVGSTSSGSSTAGSAGVTITPGTPQEFEKVDVGVMMTVTPTVQEDSTIQMQFESIKVVEFEGFMEYGGVAVAISSGTTVSVPAGFLQPVFAVREVKTTVTLFDGATVVMGGLTREEVLSVHDQVPILGDIPLIGRLFQSKGETRQKRNLLIFVTANTISPGGSIGREQFKDMRPGSVYQNPEVISPGGGVQRVMEDDVAPKK